MSYENNRNQFYSKQIKLKKKTTTLGERERKERRKVAANSSLILIYNFQTIRKAKQRKEARVRDSAQN